VRKTTTPVVAVDGPSGSGKSSVSRGVARALGLRYLDTGAMYRALTWAALRDGIDTGDRRAVAQLADRVALAFSTDPDESWIEVDGVEVTRAIREQSVTAAVSAVAAVPEARQRLVDAQRRAVQDAAAAGEGVVVEGRDIGSVVLPEADLKVWLVADPAVRAARRAAEELTAGRATPATAGSETAVQADLARRDAADAARAASPAAQAPDAVVVDATHLSLAEVIDAVLALLRERVEVVA
jgi:CMP/dCMP kinase